MNALNRIIRSMRNGIVTDTHFENYYGSLVRQLNDGAPSASEARRDFRAARASLDRVIIF